jgi:Holliday junction resolvase-like predicted endonuclease
LQQQGLRLLAQNWLCKRGELDLVMLDGDTVVFVEVRYRKTLNGVALWPVSTGANGRS